MYRLGRVHWLAASSFSSSSAASWKLKTCIEYLGWYWIAFRSIRCFYRSFTCYHPNQENWTAQLEDTILFAKEIEFSYVFIQISQSAGVMACKPTLKLTSDWCFDDEEAILPIWLPGYRETLITFLTRPLHPHFSSQSSDGNQDYRHEIERKRADGKTMRQWKLVIRTKAAVLLLWWAIQYLLACEENSKHGKKQSSSVAVKYF